MGVVVGVPRPEVAHHEAGHAVMVLRLGLPLYEVLVWEQQRLFKPNLARGHTKLAKRSTFEVPPIKTALVLLAGPEAQAIYLHRVHGHSLRHARSYTSHQNQHGDMAEFYRTWGAVPNDPWARDVFSMRDRVKRMVAGDWPAVAALAQALLRKPRLSGREVRRVVA